mmetsp:Transcript_82253/g.207580  ORF Transcript_82253/g.207580 Transcript_82253/m.207580 type:complete len:267 (-) Transcript_82253:725-1525(-)
MRVSALAHEEREQLESPRSLLACTLHSSCQRVVPQCPHRVRLGLLRLCRGGNSGGTRWRGARWRLRYEAGTADAGPLAVAAPLGTCRDEGLLDALRQRPHGLAIQTGSRGSVALLQLMRWRGLRLPPLVGLPCVRLGRRSLLPRDLGDVDLAERLLGHDPARDVGAVAALLLPLAIHDAGVAQGVHRVLRVFAARGHRGDDHRLVPVQPGEATPQDLSEPVLAEGHKLRPTGGRTDAVLQSGERSIYLGTLFTALGVVLRAVHTVL